MTTFQKLQLKDQQHLAILNPPPSFAAEIAQLGALRLDSTLHQPVAFLLAFITRRSEVAALAPAVDKYLPGDSVVWFAYPKGTSKTLKADLNRDAGWEPLTDLGYETVRAVSIDLDWSALRFRRTRLVGKR